MSDGLFRIRQMPDAVYLDITPPTEGGKPVDITDIVDELNKTGVTGYELINVLNELEMIAVKKTYKITNLQESTEVPEKYNDEKNFVLYTSEDQMKLFIKFFFSDQTAPVDKQIQDIKEDANKLKITAPLDEDELRRICQNIQYNQEFMIARGVPVVESQDAKIEYHFQTERDFRPEIDADGNVDYHKLHVVANVKKGDKLATLIPGVEGLPGRDVYGVEYKPKKVKPMKLRRGKNVGINETSTELYAELDGLVKIDDGKVVVLDTFDIPNNVGNSTGDVDFAGSIVVNGNVVNGFKVVAKGDIEVVGVVEGAILEAGGNILLHRGIQGMNRCKVTAGGNVVARYIENAEVIAGGSIHSEAIMHSNVSAKQEIKVEGRKGMITGGTVRSGTEISANILGSHMGTVTNIEVGIDPVMWEEYTDLVKSIPKMKEEAEKLEQVIVLLNKRKEIEGDLDEQKKNMYLTATRNKIILTNKISMADKRFEELKVEVERRHDGKVKARNMVYPGVRVTIGNVKYYVRDELQYVCMVKDGADIRLDPL